MNFDEKIYKYIEDLGGTYTIENGIVTVTMPDGSVWDFTKIERVGP